MNTLCSLIPGLPFKRLAFLGCLTLLLGIGEVQADPSKEVAQCQRVIVSGDPDYPPFSWYDGNAMHGASIDIVVAALERIHLPYEVRYVGPFSRMLQSAKIGDIDIVSELKNLPERQQFMAFSSVPIFSNPIAVFTLKNKVLKYKTWGDLAGWRGGITNANKFGGGFDEYLAQHLSVETANDIKVNFDKLAHDRIDYFVTSYYPGMNYLISQGRQNEFVALQPFVTETENFVGWSRNSPCLSHLEEFNAALVDIVHSGEAKNLIKNSLAKGVLR